MTMNANDLGPLLRRHYAAVANQQPRPRTLGRVLAAISTTKPRRWPLTRDLGPIPATIRWAVLAAALLLLMVLWAVFVGSRHNRPETSTPSSGAIVIAVDGIVGDEMQIDVGDPRDDTHVADLYLVQDGHALRFVGAEGDGVHQTCPAFSADGTLLAYAETPLASRVRTAQRIEGFSWTLHVVSVTSTAGLGTPAFDISIASPGGAVTAGPPCVKWSPAGDRLAFVQDNGVQVIDLAPDGVQSRLALATLADGSSWHGSSLAWSPDGSTIAFSSGVPPDQASGGAADVWLVPASGGDSTRITIGSATEMAGPVAWSPDGGKLAAYVHDTTTVDVPGTSRLVLIDIKAPSGPTVADGRPGLFGSDLAWAPNDVLAYIGDGSVVVDDLEGGSEVVFSNADLPEVFAAVDLQWSPDGQQLVFLAEKGGLYALVAAPASGHGATVLTPWTAAIYPPVKGEFTWQPVYP